MGQLDWLRAVTEGEPVTSSPPAVDAVGRPTLDEPERYADRGILGAGGMGTVRTVRDLAIRRDVAVKVLHSHLVGKTGYLQAFVEEALVTGQLSHPNIVPLHELGRDARGTVYFTMPKVRGQTLQEILKSEEIPPGSSHRLAVALEVFLKVCDAIAYAHSQRVIHRDLKAANVMVGAFGEVYLVDWGLAKVLRHHGDGVEVPRGPLSPRGACDEPSAGTPSYMAPEQAADARCRADERTDIFGLGAMLYEIVTGEAPYEGARPVILERAKACAFTPPDEGRDFYVPKRLARVIMKAMSAKPEDRYATVEALADQVREFVRRGHHLPTRTFPAGSIIVKEGEPGDCAYILTRGECLVHRDVAGVTQIIRRMPAPSIFGEAAILGSADRSATVEATTDVTVVVITREDIEERLPADTWEGLLVRTLVARFRERDATSARDYFESTR